MFSLKKERINWAELLGKGSHGKVYPYQKAPNDKSWVVKVVHVEDQDHLFRSFEEIVLGFSCDHKGIVPLRGYNIEKLEGGEYKVYLKMPRLKDTLHNKLKNDFQNNKKFSEKEILSYFYSLVCSVDYLHKKRIAHRDIRPMNIMVDYDDSIKLSDVGIAQFIGEEEALYTENKRIGSLAYTAPEIKLADSKLKKKDLFKADAWSLGLTIAEICLGKIGVYNYKSPSFFERETELKAELKKIQGKFSEKLISLLRGLLEFDPAKRMSIESAKAKLEEGITSPKKDEKGGKKEIGPSPSNILNDYFSNSKEEVKEERERGFKEEAKFSEPKKEKEASKQFPSKKKEKLVKAVAPQDQDKSVDKISDLRMFSFGDFNASEKSLTLNKCFKITDSDFKAITGEIERNFKDLMHLHIDFHGVRVPNDRIINLFTQIGNSHKTLQTLHLNLKNCETLTEKGIEAVAKQIANNLGSLKNLFINLRECKNTSKAIKGLGTCIGENLKELRNFKIKLDVTPRTTDLEIILFTKKIANLTKLKHLALHFKGECEVSDDTIKNLMRIIQSKILGLESFELDVKKFKNLTDVSVVELANQIGNHFKSLKKLVLGFDLNSNISDDGVDVLAVQIGNNLKNLQYLGLSFFLCSKVSEFSIYKLALQAKYLSKLQEVKLQFTERTITLEDLAQYC